MSTDTATVDLHDDAHEDGHVHFTDKQFVMVAVILAVVTAVEVAWSYIGWPEGSMWTLFEVGGLLLMMGFKFFVVASYFMHLKFDSKLLTGVFYFGLVLAVAVYLAVLFAFEFFSSSPPPYV